MQCLPPSQHGSLEHQGIGNEEGARATLEVTIRTHSLKARQTQETSDTSNGLYMRGPQPRTVRVQQRDRLNMTFGYLSSTHPLPSIHCLLHFLTRWIYSTYLMLTRMSTVRNPPSASPEARFLGLLPTKTKMLDKLNRRFRSPEKPYVVFQFHASTTFILCSLSSLADIASSPHPSANLYL